ncbi:MAG: helix-turn-helix domain-containing protein [Bacteroidetes bacterium]|nr:helix-turn-helix domain-containing protein [Bacteroidota bacterium]
MENEIISIFSKEEFQEMFLQTLQEFERKKLMKGQKNKSYSINQVAKRLGRSHGTITSLIKKGTLKATADKRITEYALEEYLNSNTKLEQQV